MPRTRKAQIKKKIDWVLGMLQVPGAVNSVVAASAVGEDSGGKQGSCSEIVWDLDGLEGMGWEEDCHTGEKEFFPKKSHLTIIVPEIMRLNS